MSRPWESKLCISLILVFCTILETALRSNPTTFAIFSWVQPLQKHGGQALQKDGGQARRFNRMIMISRPALCRAQISEIQELTVCFITPQFLCQSCLCPLTFRAWARVGVELIYPAPLCKCPSAKSGHGSKKIAIPMS